MGSTFTALADSKIAMTQPPESTRTMDDDDGTNGLYLNGHYIPEDVLLVILSHVEPKSLLRCKLVCKLWNDLIKSRSLWHELCARHHMKPKNLPWYLYYMKFATDFFDTNLIRNGNAQEKYDHWVIKPVFSGDGFAIEEEPQGSMPLPEGVEEFCGRKSCFATSFGLCSKQQIIKVKSSKIRKHILDQFQPTLVASEWFAPRFDCSSRYNLAVHVVHSNKKFKSFRETGAFEQWTEGQWKKVTLEVNDYGNDVDLLVYIHEGQDQLFWKGHYGSKMAGASLKVLFDSIEEEH